ncbi:MAG: tetratricopeptide repeat protein [Deltaproteobacteria bacterium]|nr:tetratricopeptide repeat protein [Deltaproteobacteria bacterium]
MKKWNESEERIPPFFVGTLVGVAVGVAIVLGVGCAHAPKKIPPQVGALLNNGAQFLARGDLNRAEATFSMAVEYRPNLAKGYNGLGLVAMARGERRRAERLFVRALSLNEDLAEAHNNLGVLLCRRHKYEQCRQHLIAALGIDPGYSDARHNLVLALLRQGRLVQARGQLVKLTVSAPQKPWGWAQLALIEIRLRQFASAGRDVARALELDPKMAAAHKAKGRLLQIRSAHVEAVQEFRRALAVDASDWQARHYLAVSLIILNQPGAAIEQLLRVLARKPKQPEVLFALGYALFQQKRFQEAISILQRALKVKPKFVQAVRVIAACRVGLTRGQASWRRAALGSVFAGKQISR